VSRARDPFAATDLGHVAERKTGPSLQPAERDLLNQREDVALKSREIDELAVLFVPLACLALAGDVRASASNCCGRAVGRIGADGLLLFDRLELRAVERLLILLALVVREAVVAVDAATPRRRTAAAFAGQSTITG
jgi:hypothetical protein